MVIFSMDVFLITLLAVTLIVSAVNDLQFQKIPNLVTYPSMAMAIGYHSAVSGLDGLLFSTGGLVVSIALFLLPYSIGAMGAGDAKLMGAAGAVIGPKGALMAVLFTAVAGGIYAVVSLMIHRQYLKRFSKRHMTTLKTFVLTGQIIPTADSKDEQKPKLSYGVAIALGTFAFVFLELSGHMWLS